MSLKDQQELLNNFIENVKSEMNAQLEIGKIPEEWNGFELRHYVAWKFNEQDHMSKSRCTYDKKLAKRRRECENDIIVKNL